MVGIGIVERAADVALVDVVAVVVFAGTDDDIAGADAGDGVLRHR